MKLACWRFFLLFAWLYLIHLPGSSARPSMRINPKCSKVKQSQPATFTCNANQSLIGCQFMGPYGIIDLSKGAASQPPAGNKYHGSGLQAGHCGIVITKFGYSSYYHIGCRVRSEKGGWLYDKATLLLDDSEQVSFDSYPAGDVVVLPGNNVTILHSLKNQPNDKNRVCEIYITSLPKTTFQGWQDPSLNKSVAAYFGAGLEQGDCGVQLFNITDDYNGLIGFSMDLNPARVRCYDSLIVAKPPKNPVLKIATTIYTVGDNMTATCRASNSRPVANLTWLFGDEVIRSDRDDDSVASDNDTWCWSYELQSITQTISRQLSLQDHGKQLVCQTQHVAIQNQGVVNQSRIITVNSGHTEFSSTRGIVKASFLGVGILVTAISAIAMLVRKHRNNRSKEDHVQRSVTLNDNTVYTGDVDAKRSEATTS